MIIIVKMSIFQQNIVAPERSTTPPVPNTRFLRLRLRVEIEYAFYKGTPSDRYTVSYMLQNVLRLPVGSILDVTLDVEENRFHVREFSIGGVRQDYDALSMGIMVDESLPQLTNPETGEVIWDLQMTPLDLNKYEVLDDLSQDFVNLRI